MQESQPQDRRLLYVEGGGRVDPSSVSNQALRTMNAKNMQIDKKLADYKEKLNSIESTLKEGYTFGKEIKTKIDTDAISSMKLKNANSKLEYENLVREGGIIDTMNISNAEKLRRKEEAGAILKTKLNANSDIINNQKGFFSKIFGTEDLLNKKLEESKFNADQIASDVDAKTQLAYKKYNEEESKVALQEMVLSMNQSNIESGVYGTRDEVIKNIDYAVSIGILTESEGKKAKLDTLSQADVRANQVFLNNMEDLSLKGNYKQAYELIANKYNAVRENKVYQNSNKRVEIETSLRNALLGLEKEIKTNNVKNAIYTSGLSYTITGAEATQDLPDEIKQKVLSSLNKRTSKTMGDFTTDMLEWGKQNGLVDGNADITDYKTISNFQAQEGVGYASAFTNQKAGVFVKDFADIGVVEKVNVNGKERQLTPSNQFTRFVNNNLEQVGSMENLVKEAKYHLPTEGYILLNAINNGVSIESLDNEINLIIGAKNRGEFGIKEDDKLDNKALIDFQSTERGKYLEATNQLGQLNKEAKAYRMIAGATGEKDIKKVVNKMNGNKAYIVNSKMNLELDQSKYGANEVEGSINTVLANPEKYLGIKNPYGVLYDFIVAESTENNTISFYDTRNASKYEIARFKIEDLPKSNTVGEYRALELQTIQKSKQKKDDLNLDFKDILKALPSAGGDVVKNLKDITSKVGKKAEEQQLKTKEAISKPKESKVNQKILVDKALAGGELTAEELGSLDKTNYNLIKNVNKI